MCPVLIYSKSVSFVLMCLIRFGRVLPLQLTLEEGKHIGRSSNFGNRVCKLIDGPGGLRYNFTSTTDSKFEAAAVRFLLSCVGGAGLDANGAVEVRLEQHCSALSFVAALEGDSV